MRIKVGWGEAPKPVICILKPHGSHKYRKIHKNNNLPYDHWHTLIHQIHIISPWLTYILFPDCITWPLFLMYQTVLDIFQVCVHDWYTSYLPTNILTSWFIILKVTVLHRAYGPENHRKNIAIGWGHRVTSINPSYRNFSSWLAYQES